MRRKKDECSLQRSPGLGILNESFNRDSNVDKCDDRRVYVFWVPWRG